MFREGEIISLLETLAEKLEYICADVSTLKLLQKSTDSTISAIARELLVDADKEPATQEGEIWKPVPLTGFKSKYEVSNMGRVRSAHGRHKGKILTAYTENGTKAKKRRVGMRTASGATTRYIDWLVASAFVEPYRGSRVVHIDGDNHNDRADNLKWVW